MKNIEQIKQELLNFGIEYNACEEGLETIKGNTLIELFENICEYIDWCRDNEIKEKEFNNIFNNDLVIEDGILLCNCINSESIIVPNSVTSIGDYAFYNCKKLTSITIPNSVTLIGDYTFGNTGLKSIIIPNSVTSIGDFAFRNCTKLTSVTISNSVTTIRRGTFRYCYELISVEIPNSVTSIKEDTFGYCNPELKIIRK